MSNKSFIFYGETDSPIGPLTIVVTPKGVCKLEFGGVDQTLAKMRVWANKKFFKNEMMQNDEEISYVTSQLSEYFSGERLTFDLPLVLQGTPFQKKVWEALQQIPYGETRTYKDIAQSIGAPKAIRAVGNANNKNPLPVIIPCHRVIGSNGSLVGYGGGLDKKHDLLEIECAKIKIS